MTIPHEPFGPFTSPASPEQKAPGERAAGPNPLVSEAIGKHAAKLARQKELERIDTAKKTAQLAVAMAELGPRAPHKRLPFYLGLKISTNDFNLSNTHAEHEQFLTEMGKLGYELRCPEDDETVEYLIDKDGWGFERVIGNFGDLGDNEDVVRAVGPLYEDLLPVMYNVLSHPVLYQRTKPLPESSPTDSV